MALTSQVSSRLSGRLRYILLLAGALFFVISTYLFWRPDIVVTTRRLLSHVPQSATTADALQTQVGEIARGAGDFANHPLDETQFGEMGRRVRKMKDWVAFADRKKDLLKPIQKQDLEQHIEAAMSSAFPFLRTLRKPEDPHPFATMRARHVPGTRGIVIPAGRDTFRFACHLVVALRDVLRSELPIQVMYAGEEDLPSAHRSFIQKLGDKIETVDVTAILDDKLLDLEAVGWAIKAFALLVSTFEEVLMLDADSVFVQRPEDILKHHPGYRDAGALLFHDRLLWQGAFKNRHEWWEREMRGFTPSATLNKSKVYNEGYAEEGDSGVVALHTGRLEHFMGLLHVCWQNSPGPRKLSYTLGHGDKETWWFGLELSGAPYAFEDHYGAIVGHVKGDKEQKVCGFTIAHVDAQKKLLWYNGSLLKDKVSNQVDFDVPTKWMVDATWEKGATKADLSCMADGVVNDVSKGNQEILRKSVELAKQIDQKLESLV